MNVLIRRGTADDRASLAWSAAALRFCTDHFLVAVTGSNDSRPVAFLVWRRVAPDECEVLHLETDLAFRRQGIARQLLQQLKKQERSDLFLEVRERNDAARNLYRSEGFSEIGRRKQYYNDPADNAVVLKFHPC